MPALLALHLTLPTLPLQPFAALFHIPFDVGGSGPVGCCADVNHIGEHRGVKHLFKQSGDPKHGLGWAHYTSPDWVRWVRLPTVLEPGAADGSLSVLNGSAVLLWDCNSDSDCSHADVAGGATVGSATARATLP